MRLKVGSKVLCRLFDGAEGKFYGPTWGGEVIKIEPERYRPYWVIRPRGVPAVIALQRKEIKRILKTGS